MKIIRVILVFVGAFLGLVVSASATVHELLLAKRSGSLELNSSMVPGQFPHYYLRINYEDLLERKDELRELFTVEELVGLGYVAFDNDRTKVYRLGHEYMHYVLAGKRLERFDVNKLNSLLKKLSQSYASGFHFENEVGVIAFINYFRDELINVIEVNHLIPFAVLREVRTEFDQTVLIDFLTYIHEQGLAWQMDPTSLESYLRFFSLDTNSTNLRRPIFLIAERKPELLSNISNFQDLLLPDSINETIGTNYVSDYQMHRLVIMGHFNAINYALANSHIVLDDVSRKKLVILANDLMELVNQYDSMRNRYSNSLRDSLFHIFVLNRYVFEYSIDKFISILKEIDDKSDDLVSLFSEGDLAKCVFSHRVYNGMELSEKQKVFLDLKMSLLVKLGAEEQLKDFISSSSLATMFYVEESLKAAIEEEAYFNLLIGAKPWFNHASGDGDVQLRDDLYRKRFEKVKALVENCEDKSRLNMISLQSDWYDFADKDPYLKELIEFLLSQEVPCVYSLSDYYSYDELNPDYYVEEPVEAGLGPKLLHPEYFIEQKYKNLNAPEQNEAKVPYSVHHIWLTHPDKPKEVRAQDRANAIKTKQLFEKSGVKWTHIVWTNDKGLIPESVRELEGSGIEVRSIYDYADELLLFELIEGLIADKDWGRASDTLRYSIVELLGGLYADINFVFTRDTLSEHHRYNYFTMTYSDLYIENYFFGASEHHPVSQRVLSLIERNIVAPPEYLAKLSKDDPSLTDMGTANPSAYGYYLSANLGGNIDVVYPASPSLEEDAPQGDEGRPLIPVDYCEYKYVGGADQRCQRLEYYIAKAELCAPDFLSFGSDSADGKTWLEK